jgi:hypothetical protein
MSSYNRPVGVTILAIINIILAILLGILWLFVLPHYRYANPFSILFATPFWILWMLITGIGLWKCTVWGWGLEIFDCGLNIVWQLVENLEKPLTGGVVLSISINVLIIIYLTRPNVKEAFGKKLSLKFNRQIRPVSELSTLPVSKKKRKQKIAKFDLQTRTWRWEDPSDESDE